MTIISHFPVLYVYVFHLLVLLYVIVFFFYHETFLYINYWFSYIEAIEFYNHYAPLDTSGLTVLS